jgi:hypothetical protein
MLPILNPYFELTRTLFSSQIDAASLDASRKKLIWAYSWAIPSPEAIEKIDEITRHSPLLELGAGTGYWGWLLRQAGARINCWDANPGAGPHWSEVEYGTPEMMSELPDLAERTLLLVWPPLDEPMAEQALEHFTGRRVVLVGEWRGRTGSSAFHDHLEREYALDRTIEIPRWPGFHDSIRIFSR